MTDMLLFSFPGQPPRHPLQSSRGVRVVRGRPMFFTKAPAAREAAMMQAAFKARLPEGWTPHTGPASVSISLVYPLRKRDRVPDDDALIPHDTLFDVDNQVKSILDSGTRAGLWKSDASVYRLHVEKWRGRRPRWSVRVEFEDPLAPRQRKERSGGQQTTLPGF